MQPVLEWRFGMILPSGDEVGNTKHSAIKDYLQLDQSKQNWHESGAEQAGQWRLSRWQQEDGRGRSFLWQELIAAYGSFHVRQLIVAVEVSHGTWTSREAH